MRMPGIGLKSTGEFGKRRQLVWKLIRPFVPPKPRWFFEGHPRLRGQLWFADRKLVYYTVRTCKPRHCFEIGTWKGGGSTLFIAQALCENGQGRLHTIEIDEGFYREAQGNYQSYLPHLIPHVGFHLGDYKTVYAHVLRAVGHVDLLFLDGPEDARETLAQFNFFMPFMGPGSLLLAHDWFTEKSGLLRPLIEGSPEWEVKTVLSLPRSLGFALAVKR